MQRQHALARLRSRSRCFAAGFDELLRSLLLQSEQLERGDAQILQYLFADDYLRKKKLRQCEILKIYHNQRQQRITKGKMRKHQTRFTKPSYVDANNAIFKTMGYSMGTYRPQASSISMPA